MIGPAVRNQHEDDAKMSKINLNKLSRKPFMRAGGRFKKTYLNFGNVKIQSCTCYVGCTIQEIVQKTFLPFLDAERNLETIWPMHYESFSITLQLALVGKLFLLSTLKRQG